ncbi:MAG: T9SS type A sorting domain-containing protein [Candidatus Cloacimonetes bacterium]|nr:T9SS type A sorting domain-containing protein [Candidatus Cloacimonadota bacterium]
MKNFYLIFFLALLNILFSKSFQIENLRLDTKISSNFVELIPQNNYQFYDNQVGSPMIPLKASFFEIPMEHEVENIEVFPISINSQSLQHKLKPISKALPLSFLSNYENVFINAEIYSKNILPEKWIYKTGSGFFKNKKIFYVVLYSAQYSPIENKLFIPDGFEINIVLSDSNNTLTNISIQKITQDFFKMNNNRNDNRNYLIISPDQFLSAFDNLIEWRRLTGFETYQVTISEIEANFTGIDLQEKIRNCIRSYYYEYQINYVTLGGDTDFIPERIGFAFDCGYGNDDENNLPADMYYGCLDGNWNANNNDIYGEVEDDVDYFPEVNIGRIPAENISQIENYSERLINYEKGILENYNSAGGLSMELWSDSQSELCQQYIYEQYFPHYYEIDFLYGSGNTENTAYEMLNNNQNIVQHTGHAGTTALVLENGLINTENISNLNNEYGGIFYSIGCWSAAFDYSSIGERLMITEDKGFLGYCGNSRYGWGAPSAAGFGFSEFYQKEFFKLLFWDDITYFGELNSLQKIPFVPYFGGTSVYKWVAYELNALGDSAFRLMKDNPLEFQYEFHIIDDNIYIFVHSDNIPQANVFVTYGDEQQLTDSSGKVTFSKNSENQVHLYKYGFTYKSFHIDSIEEIPFIEISSEIPEEIVQNLAFDIERNFHNNTSQHIEFYLDFEFNDNELEILLPENTNFVDAFGTIAFPPLNCHIKSTSESFQMPDGKNIILIEKVYNSLNDSLITKRSYNFIISAPEINIMSCQLPDFSIDPGSTIEIPLELGNIGNIPANGITINFINSDYYTFENPSLSFLDCISHNETISASNRIFISPNTPENYSDNITFEILTQYNSNQYIFTPTIYLPMGSIGFKENFEEEPTWTKDEEWKIVDTFSDLGNYSFSCRPEQVGTYQATTPGFLYVPNMMLEFPYKYKMPMYGEDGVYFILNQGTKSDTILFLGAGGALERTPYVYIENDWEYYSFELDEILTQILEMGTTINLQLVFKYSEIIPDFNEYASMPDIGIFIDKMQVFSQYPQGEDVEYEQIDNFECRIFPNPIKQNSLVNIQLSLPNLTSLKIDIYNIKGQKVKTIFDKDNVFGQKTIFWNLKDNNERRVKSGKYFFKTKTNKTTTFQKITILP